MSVSAQFFQAETVKASGDYESARPIYEDHVLISKAYLQAALELNRKFPKSTWDISPIFKPLVNATLVLADLVQALNDRESTNALRGEAKELSVAHLEDQAAPKRSVQLPLP